MPALCIIIAALLWGCIGPLAKLAMADGMHPAEIAFFRILFGWVLFGGEAVLRGRTHVARRDLLLVLGFGVCGVAGLFGMYMNAVEAGGAALASVLLYTAPAWVALLSRLLLGELLTPRTLAAVALTILGVAGVSFGADTTSTTIGLSALLFGLGSGLSYALYFIFGKLFEGRYQTSTLFLYAMPAGLATMACFSPFNGLPGPTGLAACAALAVLSTYGAYRIYYIGLAHMPATRAAVLATLEPVFAAGLAYAMFGEQFGWLGYAGGGLILAAVAVTIKRSSSPPATSRHT
ncbi:MAG: DMT family transporter [Desulfovibrio sp.]|nr:DMT family transporter [Desulfovibrio sp.]MCA1987249.1 DMT family transporter [Desulfovibrio sp.]